MNLTRIKDENRSGVQASFYSLSAYCACFANRKCILFKDWITGEKRRQSAILRKEIKEVYKEKNRRKNENEVKENEEKEKEKDGSVV